MIKKREYEIFYDNVCQGIGKGLIISKKYIKNLIQEANIALKIINS
jgi:hypothetical protein